MRGIQWLGLRLRAIFRRAEVERELDEELRHHLEREAEERVRRGVEPERARRAAVLALGGVEGLKEECRDARGLRLLEELRQDLRYGIRSLRRSPVFTVVVVGILGLAIGLTTALFAAWEAVLLEPLPYRHEDRLLVIAQLNADSPLRDQLAPATFLDLQQRTRAFDGMAAAIEHALDAMGPEGPESVPTWRVSEGFFELLGSQPLLGRTFHSGEHRAGHEQVVVLGHRYWQRRFAGDPAVVGRVLVLDGEPHEVVGVMPPGFAIPRELAIWSPLVVGDDDREERFASYWHTLARLAPGRTAAAAQRELDDLAAELAAAHPRSNEGVTLVARGLRDEILGEVRPALSMMMAAVALLLVVACANVANLVLARTAARARELAVRTAMGAGRGRVRRQLLTEGALLAAGGCAAGLLVAWQGVEALLALAPADLPRRDEIGLDSAAWGFAVALAALTVLGFAAVPASRAARRSPQATLRGNGARATAGIERRRLSRGLVVASVALSFVLVVGAGLLVRSFAALHRVETGYAHQQVYAASFFVYGRYNAAAERVAFLRELGSRLEALPGARSVGFATALPLMEQIGREDAGVRVLGRETGGRGGSEELQVRGTAVTPGYFPTLGIPLRHGRLLGDGDHLESAPVALLSEALASRLFPGEDPLGREVAVSFPYGPQPRRIVGVVGDVRHARIDEPPVPTVYVPLLQAPVGALDVIVRSDGDPAALGKSVAATIWQLAPTLPLHATATLSGLREASLRGRQFLLLLVTAFALTALLLAALGVYGVLSGLTRERRQEIGVRLVLGARGRDVLAGVLGDSARLGLAGLTLGALAAVAGTRWVAALLFEVTPLDAPSFAAGAALVLLVALLGGLVPAWRATRVQPVVTLGTE